MKAFNTILVLIFALSFSAFAQSLTLFDIDTTNFPTMRAKFYAIDKDGNQLRPSINELTLTEDGEERTITNVSCPEPVPAIDISSVLIMDASGSMAEGNPIRLDLAKTAATAWINGLPTTKSECAITSFDGGNYFIQDFTTNRQLLLKKANSLFAQGGTDYNKALIEPLAGGLIITKSAKYKKVLIMLTDGLPNFEPRVNEIISEANRQNVIIYAVTLNMLCPQNLKDITTKTGGLWFEDITTLEKAKEVYQSILKHSTGNQPCTIEWQSGISCIAGITNVELRITNLYLEGTTNYQSSNSIVAKLEFNPRSLKFDNPTLGITTPPQTVIVTALNADFAISNISIKVPVGFDINPKSFNLKTGESIELTVTYTPADSGYTYCRFDVDCTPCPTRFYVGGGWKGKKPTIRTIKLLHPNGGEVFVVGSDTVITWEGVSPDELVKLEYSTNNGMNWITIADSAIGLSYNWRVPKTPSNQCIAMVTAEAKSGANFNIEMELIPAGTFQMGNTGAYSGWDWEKPVHTVTISREFLMSKYEITQKQYEKVMGTNPSNFKGENLPIEMVSWYEAVEFCNKLSDIEGLDRCYSWSGTIIVCDWAANGYRLPTEAEWEYACKAGTTTDLYSGSLTNSYCNPIDINLDRIGWYCGNEFTKIRKVGQKEPNAFGLYDMSGNVWEWCWDGYEDYTSEVVTDPKGASSGSSRVCRGGGWNGDAFFCRSAYRDEGYIPERHEYYIGFRVVRNP